MAPLVLVIDDEHAVRSSIAAYLDDSDFQVIEAESATEALSMLNERPVDIVVCDLKMPGMYGIELLGMLKIRYPDIPVIIISGAGDMGDVVEALRLGADDYLEKPILDLTVLQYALSKALKRAELEADNRAYRSYLEKTNTELRASLEELRTDQQAGRQAQMRMLPEVLEVQGVSCTHQLIPSLMLSGDFLDYFEVDGNRLVFYVADVSGHGASSAFVTVLLKNFTYRLRRNLHRGYSDDVIHPDKVLSRLNRELLASELDKHLTIVYAVLCLQTRTLRYSVGGHFPMPLLVEQESARFLAGRAMPVGLFAEASYQTLDMQLPDDFSLMMFSDGILEVIPDSDLNEKEETLRQAAGQSRGSIDNLLEQLSVHEDTEVPDDIAILSIRRGCL